MFARLRDHLLDILNVWEEDVKDEDVMDFSENDLLTTISNVDSFKLYRYTPASYYNIRNIETQTIHLSENGVMNDVFEGLPETDAEIEFSSVKQLEDLAAMTCMSETNNSILMWSHYASSHSGVCVEYDLKLLKNDTYKILQHIFPVIYREKRHAMKNLNELIRRHKALKQAIAEDCFCDEAELLDDILPLFLTKSSDWEYEKEWRVLYTKKQMYDANNEVLYRGNLKFECITGVYLGYRIDPEIRKNILEICERISDNERKISVYQAKLEPHKYQIVFDKLF